MLTIFTRFFRGGQVVVTLVEQDVSYVFRKRHQKYKALRLDINFGETVQMVIGIKRRLLW